MRLQTGGVPPSGMCVVAIRHIERNCWLLMDQTTMNEPIASPTSSQDIVVPNAEAFFDVLLSLKTSNSLRTLQTFQNQLERGNEAERRFWRSVKETLPALCWPYSQSSSSTFFSHIDTQPTCQVQTPQPIGIGSNHSSSSRICGHGAFVRLFCSCRHSWFVAQVASSSEGVNKSSGFSAGFIEKEVPSTLAPPLIQKLFMELEKTDEDRDWLEGLVWKLARDRDGTHLVQQVIENCNLASQKIVLKALEGKVYEACNDKWANYLLQKCMDFIPCEIWQEHVIKGLDGKFADAAKSNFGCRVLERLIDHTPMERITQVLKNELFKSRGDKTETVLRSLIVDKYGNFVIQRLLEHDRGDIQEMVTDELCRDHYGGIHELTGQEIASKVVDQAIIYCKPHLYAKLVKALMKTNVKYDWKQRYRSFVLKNLRASLAKVLNEDRNERREYVLELLKENHESLGVLKVNALSDAAVKALQDQGITIPKNEPPDRGERINPDSGSNAMGEARKGRRNRRMKTQDKLPT